MQIGGLLARVLVSLLLLPLAARAECPPPSPGIVSWWPGDGNASDAVGANSGTLVNGATFADGKLGQAFSLDGADDRIDVGNDVSLTSLDSGTVSAWILVPSSAASSTGHAVFGYGGDGGEGLVLWVEVAVGGAAFRVNTFAESPHTVKNSLKTTSWFGTDHWHQVVWVSTGAAYQMYVDGVSQFFTLVLGSNDGRWIGDISPGGNDVVLLGARRFEGMIGLYFDGLVDELQVFDRALSAEERQAAFAAGSACVNRVPVFVPWGFSLLTAALLGSGA